MFKFLIRLSIILAIIGALYQYNSSQYEEHAHQPVGKLIDIGGCQLHMIDSHAGATTVVIDSGIGGKTLDWCLVQPEIAKFARVITYDRAGYGWSDASSLPRTSENIVKELHTMLHNAQIPAPYILVGHSFGGMNMRLFASTYPNEVAGVVLVEAMHENLFDQIPQLRPSMLFAWLINAANHIGFFRALRTMPSQERKIQDAIAKYPIFLQRIYLDQMFTTKYINAMTQEIFNLDASCKALKIAGGLLADKPLLVMTVDTSSSNMQKTISAQDMIRNTKWLELQADLVSKSSRGQQEVIHAASSNISYDRPQVIVEGVRKMVQSLEATL